MSVILLSIMITKTSLFQRIGESPIDVSISSFLTRKRRPKMGHPTLQSQKKCPLPSPPSLRDWNETSLKIDPWMWFFTSVSSSIKWKYYLPHLPRKSVVTSLKTHRTDKNVSEKGKALRWPWEDRILVMWPWASLSASKSSFPYV